MNTRGSARRDGVATNQGEALLLSVPDAAHLLSIGKTLCWQLVRAGAIPTVRVGRRVLVPRAGLEQHVASWYVDHPMPRMSI